ncbi:hypothetical protein GEMRC1_003940 [Eukaryota sp. GEM-RC1]
MSIREENRDERSWSTFERHNGSILCHDERCKAYALCYHCVQRVVSALAWRLHRRRFDLPHSRCGMRSPYCPLVFGLTAIVSQVFASLIPLIRGMTSDKDRDKTVKMIGGIVGLIAFVSFIILNVQTFGSEVCEAFLRNFCFWGIIAVYVLIPVAIITICCLACTTFRGMS